MSRPSLVPLTLFTTGLLACTIGTPAPDPFPFLPGDASSSGADSDPTVAEPQPFPDLTGPEPAGLDGVPVPVCGDGQVDPGESCDDGNLVDGDGCEADCTLPHCGNGIVDPQEWCYEVSAVALDGAPSRILVGDLDDDGRQEVLAALPTVPGVARIAVDPAPTPPHVSIILAGADPRDLALADTALDGLPEVFVLGSDGVLRLENVSGTPGPGTLVVPAPDLASFVPLHLDLDGRMDLLVARPTVLAVPGELVWYGGGLHALLGQPDGGFEPQSLEQLEGLPHTLLPTIGGDDLVDLFALIPDTGTLVSLAHGATGQLEALHTKHVSNPVAITTLHADDDGVTDLALALAGTSHVLLLPGDGAGGFEPAKLVPVGAPILAMTATDLNGDGLDDLAVTTAAPELVLLEGHGHLQLTTAFTVALTAAAVDVDAGDVDGDGLVDLALSTPALPGVTLVRASP